jgi:hypothetical protein
MPYKRRVKQLAPPLASLTAALVALGLWVAGVPLGWLDGLCGAIFVAGAVAAVVSFVRGPDASVKRLSVLAIGANALGLLWLALIWLTG